ncbi:MAG: DNA alkylation repair protein [Renibacterium salmoninarum]|nr:DNA alkylation repair protein [Renibacterium salmoninarum]
MPADRAMITAIRQELAPLADPERAASMAAYMKSSMPYRGVPLPAVRKVVAAAAKAFPPADAEDLRDAATELWRSAEFREERYAAAALCSSKLARGDLPFLPFYCEIVSSGAWWDHVDDVAHRIAELLAAHPDSMKPQIIRWSKDPDFWFRRLAIISQLQAKAKTDPDLLSATIGANLADPEFFIRKAIGWALRDYAKTNPSWVKAFVTEHIAELSPLSRREALKHLA